MESNIYFIPTTLKPPTYIVEGDIIKHYNLITIIIILDRALCYETTS